MGCCDKGEEDISSLPLCIFAGVTTTFSDSAEGRCSLFLASGSRLAMQIFYGLTEASAGIGRPACVTWGNFDGVHLGHQSLLRQLCLRSKEQNLASVVLTFTPHPLQLLGNPPSIITPLPEKLHLLEQAGADFAVVLPFTKNVAALEAEDFVNVVFAKGLQTRQMVLGYSSFFGKGRRGSATLLTTMGKELGFEVEQMPPVLLGGSVVSSTRVRKTIAAGEMELARALLDRYHVVRGKVGKGRQLGRTLGFPTINLVNPSHSSGSGELLSDQECGMLPANGIYAAQVEVSGKCYRAAVSLGTNPTFEEELGASPRTLEAHLLDFNGDLYGQQVRIHFWRRLREQKCFNSREELVAQIKKDVEQVGKMV